MASSGFGPWLYGSIKTVVILKVRDLDLDKGISYPTWLYEVSKSRNMSVIPLLYVSPKRYTVPTLYISLFQK